MEQLIKVTQIVQEAIDIIIKGNKKLDEREQSIVQDEKSLQVRAGELDKKEEELNRIAKDIKRNADLETAENDIARRLETVKVVENTLKIKQEQFEKFVLNKTNEIKNAELANQKQQEALLVEKEEFKKQAKVYTDSIENIKQVLRS